MDNASLKRKYEKAFAGQASYGEAGGFFTFPTDDVTNFVLSKIDFRDLDVLEIGCGTGETAAAIARSGAKSVLAIDYAATAIETCRTRHTAPNLSFQTADHRSIERKFDLVLLQEVIEHLDETEETIAHLMTMLQPDGRLVLTCPNFTNLRGYVWMTLQLLLDVPMSLTDLHFFSPFDFINLAGKLGLALEWETFAHDRVYSEKLIVDMRKRLTNALRDANLDNSRVDRLMVWLQQVITIDNAPQAHNGAKGFYVFSRQ